MQALQSYLDRYSGCVNSGAAAFIASLETVASVSPGVARSVVRELENQRSKLKMIASENYSSLAVQSAMGNLLTDKYAEGYPGHRFYAGCENVDDIESLAIERAKEIFGAEHAYVQPHSGADANLIAYWAILCKRVREPALEKSGQDLLQLSREQWNRLRAELGNQKLVGLAYDSGGHLTHGYRHNVSACMFDCVSYRVDPATGFLDYGRIRELVQQEKPLILLTGYSAYPRRINFRIMREIADESGATFMVDMAHFAGLVAGRVFTGDFDPVPHAQVVTTTTHKTLRGPRGGMILCCKEYAQWVDRGCPLVIGGPLPHMIAAKAVALEENAKPGFRDYAKRIVENSQALATALLKEGMTLVSGGTDNHLMIVDLGSFGLTGRQGESAMLSAGITLNRNSIPGDPNGAWYTSGLRLGTAALTTLGMGPEEMKEIASIIRLVLEASKPDPVPDKGAPDKHSRSKSHTDEAVLAQARKRVKALLDRYPLYPELDIEVLKRI